MTTVALCQCGCGKPTTLAKTTDARSGCVKGQPNRFLRGHTFGPAGAGHVRWKGGVWHRQDGYTAITVAPRRRVQEHILIVERALGQALPKKAHVHHVNGKRSDNRNENLVACENNGYNRLLHRRQRALEQCGDANANRCMLCGGYERQGNVTVVNLKSGRYAAYHRTCNAAQTRNRNDSRRVLA